jgi:hypothetical protein
MSSLRERGEVSLVQMTARAACRPCRPAGLYLPQGRNRLNLFAYLSGTLDRSEVVMPTSRREQVLWIYHLALARDAEERVRSSPTPARAPTTCARR